LPSSWGEGTKAAGKGALISLGTGTGIFLIALAADTGDGWTAIAGLIIGGAVAYFGILASAAWGMVKGVQVSMQNQKEVARRRQSVGYGSSSSTYIVSLVDREIVPAEYLEQLDTRI
jgi:hypothetical protein